jgi:hypothetical protein
MLQAKASSNVNGEFKHGFYERRLDLIVNAVLANDDAHAEHDANAITVDANGWNVDELDGYVS